MVSLAQKLKLLETCEKRLYKHIRMVLKNPFNNDLKINKKLDFKSWLKWPPCKGYRLCKMVSLAQKLKLLKTWQKRLYKQIRMVLRKNPLETQAKNQKISRFLKLAKMATLQRL